MSRFNNVVVLLETAENYNLDEITHLLYKNVDLDTAYELAEDFAFVLISMWAMVPAEKKYEFKDRLTDEMVNVEIKEMFSDEE